MNTECFIDKSRQIYKNKYKSYEIKNSQCVNHVIHDRG